MCDSDASVTLGLQIGAPWPGCPHPPSVPSPDVCRSHQYYVQLFEKAGLRLAHTALQKDFPKGLFKGTSRGPCTSACSE